MSKIKVEAVVICDDIRQETSGKHILIGVYGGVIGLPGLPCNMTPSWWIQMVPEQGDYEIEFRVMGPNNAQLVQGNLRAGIRDPKRMALRINKTPIQFQHEGTIRFMWRLSPKDEWETLKELEVTVRRKGPNELPKRVELESESITEN